MKGYAVEEHDLKKNKNLKPEKIFKMPLWKKLTIFIGLFVAIAAAVIWFFTRFVFPKMADVGWFSNKMIALYIAIGVIGSVLVASIVLRKPLRTRLKMQKAIKDDPDINEWLVIFDWTPKVLYAPAILASFVAALLSCIPCISPAAIGGAWFGVVLLNFLIEEYSISIKVLLMTLISLGFLLLWLHLLGWVMGFLGLFRHIAISVNATVYLLVGIIGMLAISLSWLKGLFYYVTITPNYMNIQEGPTESGEQIGREDYNTRVDTNDFLERLMGFGKIIITFKDKKRQPISVLVWKIQSKAQMLEKVRAKFAIDHLQPARLEGNRQ